MAERPLNVAITGGSKNIGREIALYFAKTKFGRAGDATPEVRPYDVANVAIGYRTDNDNNVRRNLNLVKTMNDAGSRAVAVQGDLAKASGRFNFAEGVGGWGAELGGVDLLVLNAAGGLEEDVPEDYGNLINNVAQVDLVERMSTVMSEDQPTVMLLESSWSELYPDLGGPVLPGYREKVAATKKEGRNNVVRVVEELYVPIGGRALILAAGIVEGTAIGRLAEEGFPEFYEEQQEMGNVVGIKEVAEAVVEIAHDPELPHGYVKWVGSSTEALLEKYPASEI